MSRTPVYSGILSILLLFGPVSADAGLIVVSGDVTPSFYLTDTPPDPAVAGNQQFFANVLGGGTRVGVLTTTNLDAELEIDEFYNSLAGVTSNLISGALTSAVLADLDLLHIPFPDSAFTSGEVDAIEGFLNAGGSLFIAGEGSGIDGGVASNAVINGLLSALGSGLSISNAFLDIGVQTAMGSQILPDPLTAGVTSYNYGATSIVNGGSPLFLTSNESPFVAFEERAMVTPIPEPSALCVFAVALGVGGVASWLRRRGRRHN